MRPARIMLRKLLFEKDMNKAELSRITGIRPNTISNYAADMSDGIKLQHIALICKALNCQVSDLIKLDQE